MTTDKFIEFLNANEPPAQQTLGGEVLEFDEDSKTAMLRFTADKSLCNPATVFRAASSAACSMRQWRMLCFAS